MDNETLMKEYARICKGARNCLQCVLFQNNGSNEYTRIDYMLNNPKKAIELIEKWSDDNPIEIDWTKVPINTKVLVRNSKENEWEERYFVFYLSKSPSSYYTFLRDKDSTNAVNITDINNWRYCKLANDVDPTPYLKS